MLKYTRTVTDAEIEEAQRQIAPAKVHYMLAKAAYDYKVVTDAEKAKGESVTEYAK